MAGARDLATDTASRPLGTVTALRLALVPMPGSEVPGTADLPTAAGCGGPPISPMMLSRLASLLISSPASWTSSWRSTRRWRHITLQMDKCLCNGTPTDL